jgi:hypothetical protein
MGFIGDIFSAIIDVIVSIVEAVIQVVEMVVQLIMILLGWDSGSTQIIEYYEVHNVPLFDDVDNKNPLLQSVIRSVLEERDVASNLIYHTVFRSLKGNVREFLQFIDNGNYFENFPAVESYILTIDYTELTAALNTLNGVPCTPEGSYLRALSKKDWVQYWLQENKGYDVGANALGTEYREVTTGPYTPASDTVNVTPSLNHFDIAITSAVAPSDDVLADMRWAVNLNTIVYNAVPDTYTIQAYNSAGVTITLPYTAPSKPTELHYVSFYYRDSDPSRQYIFIYKVGDGTYTDLDTVETPIDEDGSVLQTLPAVPLRISNSNYTTFGATKQAAIEDLLSIIHLDAEEILDAVINDSGVAPGDLDNVYVNFGVRMWDTSQAGLSYLFTMFENLYPSQGVSQGTYNNSPVGDDKPQNNILTTTDDNKAAFQWSYITYEHTSLVDIDADSGSTENGIYYSDMSRFGDDGLLKYNYYVSSGKGTYNVGYKADNLDEVQDFLDGNGVPNPGITTTEAADWLQVTERMIYNNPSPSLLEADGSASTLTYLTGDLVYENNGSGVLRLVESASDETTVGQSMTYYCVKPSGLDAYTVVAPIGALKVIDGATGRFNMVKFNLGNKNDLMVPFVHNFIKDLSNTEVSKLFLAGAHVSIYIAHYEVIHHAGMSFLQALVMIIIIVVIVVITVMTGGAAGGTLGPILSAIGAGAFATAWSLFLAALPGMLMRMVVQYIIQIIITEIAGDNEMLAMILNLVAMVAMSAWEGNVSYGEGPPGTVQPGSYGPTGGTAIGGAPGSSIEFTSTPKSFHFTGMTSFKSLSAFDYAMIAMEVMTGINTVNMNKVHAERDLLERDQEAFQKYHDQTEAEMAGRQSFMVIEPLVSSEYLNGYLRSKNNVGKIGAEKFYALNDAYHDVPYIGLTPNYDQKVSLGWQFE